MIKTLLLILAATLSLPLSAQAPKHTFVYLKNGGVDAYVDTLITSCTETDGQLAIDLDDGPTQFYELADVDSISTCAPKVEAPNFTSFKFNNKYNHNVFTDVHATIAPTGVTASVGCIGKYLTPSFQLDNPKGVAYILGEKQESKITRRNFASGLTYSLGIEGIREMKKIKVKDAVWSPGSEPGYTPTPIQLTADMLSTNAPSNFETREGLWAMLDNNRQTFFHSTWGSGDYTMPADAPYIQVSLKEDLQFMQFSYTTRPDNGEKVPSAFAIQVSKDGKNWNTVKTVKELPTGAGMDFTSDFIDLGGKYRRLRFVMTETPYRKKYLCLAEFSIYEGIWHPGSEGGELMEPAEYAFYFMPYGAREVPVSIDWLADRATTTPRIDITTNNGRVPESNTKDIYIRGKIEIDGAGIFPDFSDSMNIKGRGNSSWGYPKKPYRLKFDEAVKPFGLTKGKSWVLLANAQNGAMLTNAIAQKAASLLNTAGSNDIIPVELYMNGEYYGSYNFTQHVGFANNSIDIDESNAFMYELDTYSEKYQYTEPYFRITTNVKEPDLEDIAAVDKEEANRLFYNAKNLFNNFTKLVKRGDDSYVDRLDVDNYARFITLNELVLNFELKHPKSTFLYHEDTDALHTQFVFGPVWDFDWAFGYEGSYSYCQGDPTVDYFTRMGGVGQPFFKALTFNSSQVERARYRILKEFVENGGKQELLDFIDSYYEMARPSLLHNAEKWGDGRNYAHVAATMKQWMEQRIDAVYAQIAKPDLAKPIPVTQGDVDGNGFVTSDDARIAMDYLVGKQPDSFNFNQADIDGNGEITLSDIVKISALAIKQAHW